MAQHKLPDSPSPAAGFQFQATDFKFPVLVVEDDMTSRAMLTAVLKKCGHEVVAACDGVEAWDMMQQPGAPRLVVLDWMIPGLDGVEVCRRARALDTYQPPYIIMLTSRNEQSDIVEGLRAGADDYLVKPWDAAELQARVEVGCRMIGLQDRLAEKIQELQEALNQVKALEGILPICSFCKKIRDDQNYWRQVEDYISSHSEARFTHSVCPECVKKHYPGIMENAIKHP